MKRQSDTMCLKMKESSTIYRLANASTQNLINSLDPSASFQGTQENDEWDRKQRPSQQNPHFRKLHMNKTQGLFTSKLWEGRCGGSVRMVPLVPDI